MDNISLNSSSKDHLSETKLKSFGPKKTSKVAPLIKNKEEKYLEKISKKNDNGDKAWEFKYVFHPELGPRLLWDLMILVFILYQALSVPYFICFNDSSNAALDGFDFIMNLCFIVDILISFNTGFYFKGNLVMNRKEVIKNYLKFWFWLDLIASLPYSWFIGGVFSSSDNGSSNSTSVLKLIRIFRFLKILRLVRLAKLKKIMVKIEDYIASNTIANFFLFLKLLLWVFFIAHWVACIWFYIGDTGLETHPVTWITHLDLQDKSTLEKYVTSLYWAFTTMSTVGYGDITPYTVPEKIYAMVTMIMASGVFAFTIGSIGALISKSNAVENQYREHVIAVNQYMKRKSLSSSLQFRVRRYLDYVWENKKKNLLDEKQVLILLSEPLRDEIYSHIHGVVIKFCLIFDEFEANFISQLAQTLINETFAPDDTIIEEGEMTSKMYFILNGKVIIYHSFTKSVFKILEPKKYFGEISFFTEHPRCASVKSVEFLDVLSLTRLNLESLLEKYPEASLINENILKNCNKGNYSSLLVSCYICDEVGHFATKCKNFLINLDQRETTSKWLNNKSIQETSFVSLDMNPNFKRKVKNYRNSRYNGRNVVGVPRKTLIITDSMKNIFPIIHESEIGIIESSTGDSADSINRIRPFKSELFLGDFYESSEEPKENLRKSTLRLSLQTPKLIQKPKKDIISTPDLLYKDIKDINSNI